MLSILGIILLAGIVYAGIRTPTTNWHEVEEWEIEVCSKWAGHSSPENSETESGYFAYGTTSMTLQAFKTNFGNQTLYEVYYYIEPYDGEQQYHIQLINNEKQLRYEIDSGTIGVQAGVADYYTDYLTEDYTKVRIVHKNGIFKVPIVVRE
jgi:hypothetical protein